MASNVSAVGCPRRRPVFADKEFARSPVTLSALLPFRGRNSTTFGQPVMLTAVPKMMTTIALIYQGTDCVILRGDVSGGWIVSTFI